INGDASAAVERQARSSDGRRAASSWPRTIDAARQAAGVGPWRSGASREVGDPCRQAGGTARVEAGQAPCRRCQATRKPDPVTTLKLTPLAAGLLGLGHQAGLALLLQPVAVALDHDGVAVVEQAVEDGRG